MEQARMSCARPSACMTDAHDFVSQITYSATRQVGDGPKPSRKRPPFGGLRVKKSYLERETGLEPATLCLGNRWVAFLAAPDALRQLLPENRSFWASDSGGAEHLTLSVFERCQPVKPSDWRRRSLLPQTPAPAPRRPSAPAPRGLQMTRPPKSAPTTAQCPTPRLPQALRGR